MIHLELAPSHRANGSIASLCWCINRAALLRAVWSLAEIIDPGSHAGHDSLAEFVVLFPLKKTQTTKQNKQKTLLHFFFTIPNLGFSLQFTANSGLGQKYLESYLQLKYQHVPSNSFYFSTRATICFLFGQKSTVLPDYVWLSVKFAPAERAPSMADSSELYFVDVFLPVFSFLIFIHIIIYTYISHKYTFNKYSKIDLINILKNKTLRTAVR